MCLRIVIAIFISATLGSAAEATIVKVVSCETGKPIAGAQTRALGGGQPSESIEYQVSAPGFRSRTLRVNVGTVNETCLDSATAQSGMPPSEAPVQAPSETQPGSHTNPSQATGGMNNHGGARSRDRHVIPPMAPLAEERARQNIETYERRPAIWVDPGPETDVDGQINRIGELLDARNAPPQTRTRPPAETLVPGITDTDPTPELVPDDTGLYSMEVAAGPECIEGNTVDGQKPDATITGMGKIRNKIVPNGWCTDVKAWVKKTIAISDAEENNKIKGNKKVKVPKLNADDKAAEKLIASHVKSATTAAQTDCEQKKTCTKGTCTEACTVKFNSFSAPIIKCKNNRENVKVKVIGTCDCVCGCSM